MTQKARHDLTIAHGYDEATQESLWYLLDNGRVICVTDKVEKAIEEGRNLLGLHSHYLYFLWDVAGLMCRLFGGRQHIIYAHLLTDGRA